MHFTNSDSFRLGITSSWRQKSYVECFKYSENVSLNTCIVDYVYLALEKSIFENIGCIISNVKPSFFNSFVTVDIEYYNGMIEFLFSKQRLKIINKYNYKYNNYKRFIKINKKKLEYDFSNRFSINKKYNHFFEFMFKHKFKKKYLFDRKLKFQKSQFNSYITFQRYIDYFKKSIEKDISKIFLLFKKNVNVKVFFKPILSQNINSRVICRYIRVRLEQFDSFNEVVFPMVRYVFGFAKLSGLFIKCSGRLTRQQRASVSEYRVGATSFSSVSYPLDFSYDVAILKYGASSIRVWISRGFYKDTMLFSVLNTSKLCYYNYKKYYSINNLYNYNNVKWLII